jgi:hypothetical protein
VPASKSGCSAFTFSGLLMPGGTKYTFTGLQGQMHIRQTEYVCSSWTTMCCLQTARYCYGMHALLPACLLCPSSLFVWPQPEDAAEGVLSALCRPARTRAQTVRKLCCDSLNDALHIVLCSVA